jgi:superfamily II DNA helicase RecQ
MKKSEPWIVAAAFLMQSVKGKEHYTNITNYILATELTDLAEKGVGTSQKVNEILRTKVVDGRAIFESEGNGYYSLNDGDAIQKNEDIQGVVEYLKGKEVKVDLSANEDKETKQGKEGEIQDGESEKLIDEARKLSEETRKLSDETRKLSDETMKLSDGFMKLSDENKKLREENQRLCEEAEGVREENRQLNEKLQSVKQLCD